MYTILPSSGETKQVQIVGQCLPLHKIWSQWAKWRYKTSNKHSLISSVSSGFEFFFFFFRSDCYKLCFYVIQIVCLIVHVFLHRNTENTEVDLKINFSLESYKTRKNYCLTSQHNIMILAYI